MLNLKKSVVLIGMMGSGKTAIGSRLALKLELPFIDLDKQIEKDEGKSVSEIFAQNGEPYFRQRELETIEDIVESKICILATGGGAYMNEAIRNIIKKRSISVYIKADFDVLLERVSRKNNRPLLEKGDKATILKELMQERCPYYENADITVSSTDGEHEVVVNDIIKELENWQKQK